MFVVVVCCCCLLFVGCYCLFVIELKASIIIEMKYIVTVFLFLFIERCGVIQINENSYRTLSDSDKKFIRPFHTEIVSTRVNSDSVFIYEINTNDIKALIHKQPYTWIHLWRPFCHADICQNVDYIGNLADKYKSAGVEMLFISETYDIADIQHVIKNSHFNHPVFVLQSDYYGYKLRKNRIKLILKLKSELIDSKQIWFDDYFFKDSTVIYAGTLVNETTIDSLLKVVTP